MHESEIGRQRYTENSCKQEGNGSECAELGGKNSYTHSTLADEENIENGNGGTGNLDTYGYDAIHGNENNITTSGIRGKVNVLDNVGAATVSNVNGNTDKNIINWDVGDTSHSENVTVVPEDGNQVAGNNNSTGHVDEINGNSCGNEGNTNEVTPQGEGGINENKEAVATPGRSGTDNGQGTTSLGDSEGGPSGSGAEEDEDKEGSGDEDEETGDGKEGADNNNGQEVQGNGKEDGNDNSTGQNSISIEDGDPEDQEAPHNKNDGDNTAKSEEDSDGIPEGNDDKSIKNTKELNHRESKNVNKGVTEVAEQSAVGKSQDKVSL